MCAKPPQAIAPTTTPLNCSNPHGASKLVIFSSSAPHTQRHWAQPSRQNKAKNLPRNGVLWRRGVSLSPSRSRAIPRQRWDYLARGDRPLPCDRRHPQSQGIGSSRGRRSKSTKTSMPQESKPCSMIATNGWGEVQRLRADWDSLSGGDGAIVGPGKVEVVKRADKSAVEVPIAELVDTLKTWIAGSASVKLELLSCFNSPVKQRSILRV